uniref:Uncharacterized protein n=1 Tax=Hucho hucho TaxID=62062 RepID=A0A4W5LRG1_9TELE
MMGVLNHLSTLLLLSLLPPALSHVVKNFSVVPQCEEFFMQGTTPNLPGILYDGTVRDQNRYKPICQLYNTIYRFATLYDTTNRIPVFSAYTFTGPPTDCRPKDLWMMEPQLENVNNSPEMQKLGEHHYKHQAGNYDYGDSKKDVNRGNLFPCSHAHDLDTQKSTFTLTNIVPQVVSFNGGSWNEMERNIREKLMADCFSNNGKIKAYVVTGAVPSRNNTLNNKLENQVNIPELLWTAYCCEDKNNKNNKKNKKNKKWIAGGYWGWNAKVKRTTLKPRTLGELEDMLKKYHQRKDDRVKVFPEACPR